MQQLLGSPPARFSGGPPQRQDDVALGVLRLEHVSQHLVADVQPLQILGVAQLAASNHAFGLQADVNQDLFRIDADDVALNNRARA